MDQTDHGCEECLRGREVSRAYTFVFLGYVFTLLIIITTKVISEIWVLTRNDTGRDE
ncbi:hypothetical protein Hdeb2414_s0035g00729861 [Helianthus debilis subsp. tardiflorus]